MSTYNGPSMFADVANVVYNTTTPINIYSVSNIKFNRQKEILKGRDNNKLRPVASHMTTVNEVVTFETDDVNAITQLLDASGPNSLTFDWIQAQNQLTTSPMPTQLVTINALVITGINADALTRGWGKAVVTGEVFEIAAGTDPIVFATASSPIPVVATD